MNMDKEFGNRIKKLRKDKGWTQDKLAEKLGYTSRAMISKIEKGERGIQAAMLPAIADALDVPVSYLLTGQIDEDKITLKDVRFLKAYHNAPSHIQRAIKELLINDKG